MEYTKNLKLKQPEYTDVANIADINANMATIDTAFLNLQNADTNHTSNFSNPHKVTKAQVGLGNVDDTADKDKNVLSASKLTNAVKLNGITFDGTKDIEIPATPKRTSLASDADLNEITAQGEYFASYGNTCINKPNNVKGFALKVYWNIVGSTSAITQVLYPSIGAIPMCFIRKGNSNGWADWQEVSTVGHTHTQADITDFNKPTPLKLLEDATEIDLNNIKTTGIYTSVTQTKYLHCPTTLVTDSSSKPNYAFSLIVLGSRVYGTKDTISYYTQICVDNFGGQGQNQTWIRTYYGNAGWTTWYSIYSAKNKPTLEDIVGSAVLPVSKGGTGYSTISAGYALVGNGTAQQLDTRYIRSNILQNSNDLVTSSAVYNSLNTKADKENLSELEESLSATDENVNELKNAISDFNKFCYVVGIKDDNSTQHFDVECDGINDATKIQNLINSVPEGSIIRLMAGTYKFNVPLKLSKPITIVGAGAETKLININGGYIISVTSSFVRIRDMRLIRNSTLMNATSNKTMIEFYSSSDDTITEVEIRGCLFNVSGMGDNQDSIIGVKNPINLSKIYQAKILENTFFGTDYTGDMLDFSVVPNLSMIVGANISNSGIRIKVKNKNAVWYYGQATTIKEVE